MSDNRVQKLLFSEYCDFEDMVLIESPFAQTTKDGRGIRQVHIGLTPSKLVLATDVLPPVEFVNFKYNPGVDPLIETFELVAIYPVECVSLSVYRTRKNQALKARFCNNKVLYFELGGFQNRAMFWNLWREKIKFFCPNRSGSSRSETSVGTSSTTSTLYLIDKKVIAMKGIRQMWCTFGINPSAENSSINETINSHIGGRSRWTDRHLYLGKEYEQLSYVPVMGPPSLGDFIRTPDSSNQSKLAVRKKTSPIASYKDEKNLRIGDSVQINRFGSGVKEGCNTGLFLTVDDYVIPRLYSRMFDKDEDFNQLPILCTLEQLAESAVLTWELYRANDPNKYKIRHKRRYGLATYPNFIYGYGLIETPKICKYSLQIKRVMSDVCLSQSKDRLYKNPLTKRELISSVSHQLLISVPKNDYKCILVANKPPLTYFWTPGYKYNPKTYKQIYNERLKQLRCIIKHHEATKTKKKRKPKSKLKKRNLLCITSEMKNSLTDEESDDIFTTKKPKKGLIHSFFSSNKDLNQPNELTSKQELKKILSMEENVTIWEFDSTTLAQQLTVIDKDLFLKIPVVELDILRRQHSCCGAPNIGRLLKFSQRISSLLAYELLQNDNIKLRARLMARLINVADKCHKVSNFQSCKSVLNGLQSPAVFRLRDTWAYLRKKHASKYRNFEYLCRFYRDTRMLSYQRTFFIVAHTPPFIPYIGDLINRLLGKIPDYPFPCKTSTTPSISTYSTRTQLDESTMNTNVSVFRRFLKALALNLDNSNREINTRVKRKRHLQRKKGRLKGLYEYFKPFEYSYEGREENLLEAKAFLERCQVGAVSYNFADNEKARCYLLKARHHDDAQNFLFSLSVESPRYFYGSKTNKV